MKGYKDSKWKHKRITILKRDEYKCRECTRYGKTIEATTVHHIRPLEDYPELALDSRNLISLCASCHNELHDRVTDALTVKGMELMKRIDKINKTIQTTPAHKAI